MGYIVLLDIVLCVLKCWISIKTHSLLKIYYILCMVCINVKSFSNEILWRLLKVCHKKTYIISWIVCYSDLKSINVHKNARWISLNGFSIFHILRTSLFIFFLWKLKRKISTIQIMFKEFLKKYQQDFQAKFSKMISFV